MDNTLETKKPISDAKNNALIKAREAKAQKKINEQTTISSVQQSTLSMEDKLEKLMKEVEIISSSVLTLRSQINNINERMDEDEMMSDSSSEEPVSKKRKRETIEEPPSFLQTLVSSPVGKMAVAMATLAAGRYISQMSSIQENIEEEVPEERIIDKAFKKRRLNVG